MRTAPSGERALQILESATFDLVITDLKMTGMSGMDFAKKVFAQQPGVPVVILTGYGDVESVIKALRSGVADYLQKPFSIDEVLGVVKREMAKSHARSGRLSTPSVKGEKPPRVYIFGQRDLEQIDAVLSRLRAQTVAESAMLVEQAGYVIAAKGLVNGSDLEPLSNSIIGTRSTSASLASLLGEGQDFSMSYMEGQRVSVYTTALGGGVYLGVVVPKGTRQGLVHLYAKEAVTEIQRIVQRATEAMQPQLGRPVGAAETEALHQEMAAQKVENVFGAKAAPKAQALPPEMKPMPSTVSTITFKKDKPVPDIIAGSASPPAQTPEADPARSDTSEPEADAGSTISFEEATRLGLLHFGSDQVSTEDRPAKTESPSPNPPPITFEEALKRGLLNFGDDKSTK